MASTSDALFEAISEADVGRVRSLLADDPSLATARDGQGVSALMQPYTPTLTPFAMVTSRPMG